MYIPLNTQNKCKRSKKAEAQLLVDFTQFATPYLLYSFGHDGIYMLFDAKDEKNENADLDAIQFIGIVKRIDFNESAFRFKNTRTQKFTLIFEHK